MWSSATVRKYSVASSPNDEQPTRYMSGTVTGSQSTTGATAHCGKIGAIWLFRASPSEMTYPAEHRVNSSHWPDSLAVSE